MATYDRVHDRAVLEVHVSVRKSVGSDFGRAKPRKSPPLPQADCPHWGCGSDTVQISREPRRYHFARAFDESLHLASHDRTPTKSSVRSRFGFRPRTRK